MEDQKPAVSSLETLNTPASEMEDPPCPGVRIKTEPVEEETAYSSALDPAAVTLAEGTNTREVTASHASHGATQRTNVESQEYELCEQPGAAGSHSDGGLLVDVKLETNVESRGCDLDENTEARQTENPSDSGPVVDVKQEANLEGSQLNENTAAGQSAKQWESGFVADVKQERNVENDRGELTEDTPPAGQPQAEGELAVHIKQEKIDSSEVAGGDVPADDSTVVMRGYDFVVERVHSDGEGNEDCKHSSNLRAHASTPKTDTRGRSFPSNIAGPSRSGGARSGITALPSEFSGRHTQGGVSQGIPAAGFPQVSRLGNARPGQSMPQGGNLGPQTQQRVLPRIYAPAIAALLSATGSTSAGNLAMHVRSVGVQTQQRIRHRILPAASASQTPTVGNASSGNAMHLGAGSGRQTLVGVENGPAAAGVSQQVMTGGSRSGTMQQIETSGQQAQAGNMHADSTSSGASQTSRKRPFPASSRDIAHSVLVHELEVDNDLEVDDDNDILLAAMLLPFMKLPVAMAYLLAKRARYEDDEDEDDGDDDNDDDDDEDDDDDLESGTDDDEYDDDEDDDDGMDESDEEDCDDLEDDFESDEGQNEDNDVGTDDFDLDSDDFDIDIDVDGEEAEDEEEEEKKKEE